MNKSSFSIRVFNQVSAFTLKVFDFAITTTLIARIKIRLKIVANLIASASVSSNIKIKTIRTIVTGVKLKYANFPVINIKGFKLVATSKATGKMSATVKNLLKIVATTKASMKAVVPMKLKFLRLTATASLGHFLTLGFHDSSLLNVVDVQTLEDLDFQII